MSTELLLDAGAPAELRREALGRMVAADADALVAALIELAKRDDDELVEPAACALGAVLFRRGRVDDAPLADFSAAAWVAYDHAVAALQYAASQRYRAPSW